MKNLKLFSMIIVFCLCLSLAMTANASTSEKSADVTVKSQSDKKENSVKEKNDTMVSDEKKASSQKSGEKENAANDEKQLWLNRAKDSEIFTGKASWYGRDFHNKKTASGVSYDMYTFTAAHRTLPLGTVVKVTDQHNGKSVMVCITDRGPYVHGRIIDLSYAAAKKLDLEDRGVSKVALEVLSDAKGAPLKSGHAYYVKYNSDSGKKMVGPYDAFADAAAMHEAIRQAHPEAEVIIENSGK